MKSYRPEFFSLISSLSFAAVGFVGIVTLSTSRFNFRRITGFPAFRNKLNFWMFTLFLIRNSFTVAPAVGFTLPSGPIATLYLLAKS